MAPPQESGLDHPAAPGEAHGRARAGAPRPEPSLVRVLATTLHLWLRRRVLRTPDGVRVAVWRWAALVVVAGIVAACAAGGVVLSRPGGRIAADRPQHGTPTLATPAPGTPSVSPVGAATANELRAAAWVVEQVAAVTPVACDATMCGYLQARGMQAGQQVVIRPGDALPGPATVVVATPLVRTRTGSALAASAPEILASFGRGPSQVLVRFTRAGGVPAYRAAARATVRAGVLAGRALVARRSITVSATAKRQLASGRVDPRLLSVLGKLAAKKDIYLAAFGDTGPGAAWPSPLRSVTLGRFSGPSPMQAAFRALRTLLARYRGKVAKLHRPGGVIDLTVRMPAPSPM